MIIFWIVITGAVVFALALLYFGSQLSKNSSDRHAGEGLVGTALVIGCIALVAALIGGIMAAWPNYQLWSAKIERERIVVQAVQEADAAREQARGEVFRAEGVAEANRIVNESLTPEYLRYHYINTLAENNQNVIYIPTEAGLPILEAGGQFGQRERPE